MLTFLDLSRPFCAWPTRGPCQMPLLTIITMSVPVTIVRRTEDEAERLVAVARP
jgi:hypothetical protein